MIEMSEYESKSPDDTRLIGREISRQFSRGDTVLLDGGLGAGKTEFVKGVVDNLAPDNLVQSPTFSLLNIYSSEEINLYHIDLYRLEDPEEISRAGLEEYLEPDGITLIEWASRWPLAKQVGRFQIKIETICSEKRSIVMERLNSAK